MKDTNIFTNLAEFIEHVSTLDDIVGIIEYGGRVHTNMEQGGDYDLTIIFDSPVSDNFNGIHFRVAGIPVDCMLLSVEDFKKPTPADSFYLVHLDGHILYDRTGETAKLLAEIKTKWKQPFVLSDNRKMWIRFATRHTLDKLENRLFEDELYSRWSIVMTADYAFNVYDNLKHPKIGKPKACFSFMKENDPQLYAYFTHLYQTLDLTEQFDFLKKINHYVADLVGGMWRDDEVLFHLLPNGTNDEMEQKDFWLTFLNSKKINEKGCAT